MKTEKRRIGDIGEGEAVAFLMKNGYKILERNYLRPCGEIDIVAQKKDGLHFVEVKTVTDKKNSLYSTSVSHENYFPEEHINHAKLRRLQRTIFSYLGERRVSSETLYQIDVLAIVLDNRQCPIEVCLIENVR